MTEMKPTPDSEQLRIKPAVQRLMQLARQFRHADSFGHDAAYKALQHALYEALLASVRPTPDSDGVKGPEHG